MAKRGGQPGNRNARNAREWRDAIRYVLAGIDRKERTDKSEAAHIVGLRKVARKFVEAAENIDAWALKDLGDRWDGKPTQAMELSGPDGAEFPLCGTIRFVSVKPPED